MDIDPDKIAALTDAQLESGLRVLRVVLAQAPSSSKRARATRRMIEEMAAEQKRRSARHAH